MYPGVMGASGMQRGIYELSPLALYSLRIACLLNFIFSINVTLLLFSVLVHTMKT